MTDFKPTQQNLYTQMITAHSKVITYVYSVLIADVAIVQQIQNSLFKFSFLKFPSEAMARSKYHR